MRHLKIILLSSLFLSLIIVFPPTASAKIILYDLGGGITYYHPSTSLHSILFIGDSITLGHWSSPISNPSLNGYPEVVVRSIESKYHQHVQSLVVAHSGYSVGNMLAALENGSEKISSNNNLVIIALGTNDYLHYGTSFSTFSKEYTKLLNFVKAKNPTADIVCLSAWGSPTSPRIYGLLPSNYNPYISHSCTGNRHRRTIFINLYNIYQNRSLTYTDNVHPNTVGHQKIAQQILNTIDWWYIFPWTK